MTLRALMRSWKRKSVPVSDESIQTEFLPEWWTSLAKTDPLFDSIRSEDHFQKILQNMIVKNQAEYERVRKWLEENKM